MNFAQHSNPARHTTGLGIVVGLHLIVGYALMNGLGKHVIEVLKKPLDVAIIEEFKPPPPPPPPLPKLLPSTPVVAAPPPPSFAPPPEVQVEAPVQNVITTVSKPDFTPPPAAPAAPAVPAAPPAVSVGLACPNHIEVRSRLPYPAQAQQMGLSGEVITEFTVSASGQITDVTVVKSSNRVFNSTATNAVSQLRCNSQGHAVRVRVPFVFRLES